jgi:hypothetical protein
MTNTVSFNTVSFPWFLSNDLSEFAKIDKTISTIETTIAETQNVSRKTKKGIVDLLTDFYNVSLMSTDHEFDEFLTDFIMRLIDLLRNAFMVSNTLMPLSLSAFRVALPRMTLAEKQLLIHAGRGTVMKRLPVPRISGRVTFVIDSP